MEELVQRLMASYSVYPLQTLKIERMSDNLYMVDDSQRLYALKRSSLTKETLINWQKVYDEAYNQKLSEIVPVHVTREQQLYIEDEQNIYYLSPWINGEKPTIEQFYRCLGRIHAKTKQEEVIQTKQMHDQFTVYDQLCQDMQSKLLEYVKLFEKRRYMSPFELQVCTHYRDIELALIKASNYTKRLLEETKEMPWNYSLCHGNLSFNHVIQANTTRIINWEQAHYGNAAMDLFIFYRNEVIEYDTPIRSLIDQFDDYMDENKLNMNELYLLTIYLLDATKYIENIKQYIDKQSEESMIQQVKSLQLAYRQLLFGLEWSKRVEEEYETSIFDDLED